MNINNSPVIHPDGRRRNEFQVTGKNNEIYFVGMKDIIQPYIFPSRLKAVVKEEMEKNGREIPGVNATWVTKIGLRGKSANKEVVNDK